MFRILLITIIIGLILYTLLRNKTEGLDNVESAKMELAKQIVNALTKDVPYAEYLYMLEQNKNTSYELIKQETFYELKFLFKNKQLSLSKIIEYMPDMI